MTWRLWGVVSVQGGAIIFIDELDAIGTKRFGGEQSGDREVQRTMLELLNQLDGFSSNDKIKVSATQLPKMPSRTRRACPSDSCPCSGTWVACCLCPTGSYSMLAYLILTRVSRTMPGLD